MGTTPVSTSRLTPHLSDGLQGLDLSVGAVATLGGIVGAALIHGSDAAMPFGAIVAVIAGMAVGWVNGIGIAVLGIPPLVATLAMASVVNGVLIVFVSVLQPSSAASPLLVAIGGRAISGVPNIVIVWAVVSIVGVWLLDRSAWGRRLTGTGANPLVALLSGTNTRRVKIAGYMLSSGIAALTGFCLTGYVGQAFLGLGDAYILTSIVVGAIGGVALAGGVAPYPAVIAAAIMMTMLVSLLTAINIGEAGRQIVFGATLLGFLVLDRHLAKARTRPRIAHALAPASVSVRP